MRRLLWLCALVGVVVLPLPASAAVAPLRPAAESLVTQPAVTFGWLLPPTERAVEVWIGTDLELDAHTGFFRDENAVARAAVAPDAQEHTFSNLVLPAGRYWWAVLTEDTLTGRPLLSTATPFVVPPTAAVTQLRARKAAPRGRAIAITTACTANVAAHTLDVVVSAAGREVWRTRVAADACALADPHEQRFAWAPPARLKRGTVVRIEATVTAAEARATRVATLRLS